LAALGACLKLYRASRLIGGGTLPGGFFSDASELIQIGQIPYLEIIKGNNYRPFCGVCLRKQYD